MSAIKRIAGSLRTSCASASKGKQALLYSLRDVDDATQLIDKLSSVYPNKDLKLKINNIELEATEPSLSTQIRVLFTRIIRRFSNA